MKEFTLREFIDAIELNGLPKRSYAFFTTSTNDDVYQWHNEYHNQQSIDVPSPKIERACAVGMGAINLNVDAYSIHFKYEDSSLNFRQRITSQNDNSDMTFKELADWARKEFADYLDYVMVGREFDYAPFLV